MSFKYLKKLSEEWARLAALAKREECISCPELFDIFRETHWAFCSLDNMELLPREAFRALMLMDEFTYYVAMADENYMGEMCPALFDLNYALKTEFFGGNYRSEFFVGPTPEKIVPYLLDFDSISLDDFVRFLKGENERAYNTVILQNFRPIIEEEGEYDR